MTDQPMINEPQRNPAVCRVCGLQMILFNAHQTNAEVMCRNCGNVQHRCPASAEQVAWLRRRLHACEQQLAMIHYHLDRENYSGWANVPVDLLVPLTQENRDRCDQEVG